MPDISLIPWSTCQTLFRSVKQLSGKTWLLWLLLGLGIYITLTALQTLGSLNTPLLIGVSHALFMLAGWLMMYLNETPDTRTHITPLNIVRTVVLLAAAGIAFDAITTSMSSNQATPSFLSHLPDTYSQTGFIVQSLVVFTIMLAKFVDTLLFTLSVFLMPMLVTGKPWWTAWSISTKTIIQNYIAVLLGYLTLELVFILLAISLYGNVLSLLIPGLLWYSVRFLSRH